jgi:hypothetical protein
MKYQSILPRSRDGKKCILCGSNIATAEMVAHRASYSDKKLVHTQVLVGTSILQKVYKDKSLGVRRLFHRKEKQRE